MKSLEEIKNILSRHKKELNEKFKVKKVGVFGSYVKGTQRRKSDVDILVEFYEPIGWEFIDLNEHLKKILGMKVDLVTSGALKEQIKDRVLKEVILV